MPIRLFSRTLPNRRIDPNTALLPCAMVPTQFVSFDELADIWDRVGLTVNKTVVGDALRILAPGFQELMFIKVGNLSSSSFRRSERTAIVSLENEPRPVPINSMGDGMARVLQLILKIPVIMAKSLRRYLMASSCLT